MAVKCSSGANSAMKASLVLMLLFGAVVAAHAKNVTIENRTCKLITVNEVPIANATSAILDIANGLLEVVVTDLAGNIFRTVVRLPGDVSDVVLTYVSGFLQMKVAGVTSLLDGLINTILDLVVGVLNVRLGC